MIEAIFVRCKENKNKMNYSKKTELLLCLLFIHIELLTIDLKKCISFSEASFMQTERKLISKRIAKANADCIHIFERGIF